MKGTEQIRGGGMIIIALEEDVLGARVPEQFLNALRVPLTLGVAVVRDAGALSGRVKR